MAADRLLILAGSLPHRRKAAALYESCLRDMVSTAARERGRVEVWHPRSRSTRKWLERNFPHLLVQEQADRAAGERVADAFGRSFDDGAERVVTLLQPVPTLAEATLTSAFHDLHEADAVLAPLTGGGCYLVGLRAEARDAATRVFRSVSWSAPEEWDTLLRAASAAGLSPRVLPGLEG
jgi:glycosyltransferase A (GT-A) superfamily protein (DUF2064 family)